MAARAQWRRKLKVGEHAFLWYVAEDRDGMGRVLHLFTPDKVWAIQYWLGRTRGYPETPVLVASVRGVRHPVRPVPEWPVREIATPAFVREVAEWCIEAFDVGSGGRAEPKAAPDRGSARDFTARKGYSRGR